jgi:hypothetical protein
MSAPNDRTPREQETRAAEMRPPTWKPPTTLPDPHPRPGVTYRWVRVSAAGQLDPLNLSNSRQEGWEPVRAADYPELELRTDRDSRYPDGVEVGGLLLCVASTAMMKQRETYYTNLTQRQITAVNDQLDREQDPRLRTMVRSHQSSVGFGPEARRERG